MFCPNCGTQTEMQIKFCKSCALIQVGIEYPNRTTEQRIKDCRHETAHHCACASSQKPLLGVRTLKFLWAIKQACMLDQLVAARLAKLDLHFGLSSAVGAKHL